MKEKHTLLLISNIPRKASQGPDYLTVRDERLFKATIAMFHVKGRAVFSSPQFRLDPFGQCRWLRAVSDEKSKRETWSSVVWRHSFQSIPRNSLLWEEEVEEGFWVIWIGHLSKRSYERSANSPLTSVKYMTEVTRQGNFKNLISRNICNKNCKNLNWLSRI